MADKGFVGTQFTQLTTAIGLRLPLPDHRDETYLNHRYNPHLSFDHALGAGATSAAHSLGVAFDSVLD